MPKTTSKHVRLGSTVALTAAAIGWLVTAALAAEPTQNLTAEQVLARNLAARGGAERWQNAKSLKIEGTWTAFSIDVPMTIWHQRPDRYRFDHVLFEAPATLAYDGDKAWIKSPVFGAPDGEEITDNWKRNVVQDAAFGSRLQALVAAGAAVDYAGLETVEGERVHVLKVRPAGDPEETWYLDAETFVETKRVSKTFDVFSGPNYEIEMQTFFMDYHDVDGLQIPFREERHFGTRYHVYEAATVEVNPKIEDGLFRLPEKPPVTQSAEPADEGP